MKRDRQLVALTALFVTALMAAQVLASKLIAVNIPLIGAVALPGGTLAYAATFFASDVVAELHGKKRARWMVNAGFAMNFVLLALVWIAIQAPAAQGSIDPGQFASVLGASANIVAGSLIAYVVSQHWDVFAFHAIRNQTGGRFLWLRNVGSTATSQAIDTVIFATIAFVVAPTVFGIGAALPLGIVWSIIVGQYVAKVFIALADTPFVYLATRSVPTVVRGELA